MTSLGQAERQDIDSRCLYDGPSRDSGNAYLRAVLQCGQGDGFAVLANSGEDCQIDRPVDASIQNVNLTRTARENRPGKRVLLDGSGVDVNAGRDEPRTLSIEAHRHCLAGLQVSEVGRVRTIANVNECRYR